MASNKKLTKSGLREMLELVVNMPKSRVVVAKKDANTARKFFRNSSDVAEVTEVDENLVKLIYNILCGFSCNM